VKNFLAGPGKEFCKFVFPLAKKEKNWEMFHQVLRWMDSLPGGIRQQYFRQTEVCSRLFTDLFTARDPAVRGYAKKWIEEGGAPLLDIWAKSLDSQSFGDRLRGLAITLPRPDRDGAALREEKMGFLEEKSKLADEWKQLEEKGGAALEKNGRMGEISARMEELNREICRCEDLTYEQTFLDSIPESERKEWNGYVDWICAAGPIRDRLILPTDGRGTLDGPFGHRE
jgi:hypothetical protein